MQELSSCCHSEERSDEESTISPRRERLRVGASKFISRRLNSYAVQKTVDRTRIVDYNTHRVSLALALFVETISRAPVAQSAAQPICNRQVGGFESPLGLFPNPTEMALDTSASWIGNAAVLNL